MFNLLESTVAVPTLTAVWFILVAVLWIGYFFLEGFDYGVAMLLPFLGRSEKRKRVMINTIGPLWDGNEVWLITAGGAMFAAFPGWYATLFSGLYLPLLIVLVGLILRGVAFEYRAKHPDSRYRNTLDWFATIGSFLPTLVFGVGFANFVIGLANDGLHWNGSFWGLFGPFALLGGVLLVLLFLVHGAAFIALKTKHEMHEDSEALARKLAPFAALLLVAFVLCQNIFYPAVSEFGDFTVFAWAAGIVSILGILGATLALYKRRDGWAFIGTGISIVALFAGIFLKLYGNLGFAQDEGVAVGERLNMITAASSQTTLMIMTWAAVIFVPIVIGYQSWSYWVFSRRISTKNIPDEVDAAA